MLKPWIYLLQDLMIKLLLAGPTLNQSGIFNSGQTFRTNAATLKTSSSVTANVLSSFPVRLLISFWSSFVSDRICGVKHRW